MWRHAPLLLALTLTPACAHKEAASGAKQLYSEVVTEGASDLSIELTYEPAGSRTAALILRLQLVGIEETDKLVAEVYLHGLNIEDGSTRWEGFVPPRQPQSYRVALSVPEGSSEATATFSLQRSHDSHVLLHRELAFAVDASGQVTVRELP